MRWTSILTLVHEAASVPPLAFERYLPAPHDVQAVAALPENHPVGHCKHPNSLVLYALDTWLARGNCLPRYRILPPCGRLHLSHTCQRCMHCKRSRHWLRTLHLGTACIRATARQPAVTQTSHNTFDSRLCTRQLPSLHWNWSRIFQRCTMCKQSQRCRRTIP